MPLSEFEKLPVFFRGKLLVFDPKKIVPVTDRVNRKRPSSKLQLGTRESSGSRVNIKFVLDEGDNFQLRLLDQSQKSSQYKVLTARRKDGIGVDYYVCTIRGIFIGVVHSAEESEAGLRAYFHPTGFDHFNGSSQHIETFTFSEPAKFTFSLFDWLYSGDLVSLQQAC
jgi:hypothetical protein